MATAIDRDEPETGNENAVVRYSPTEAQISTMREEFSKLTASTRDGYELVRQAIAQTRTFRVEIEKRRKQLKAGALEYGRRVDSEANRLTELLFKIEEPLKAMKQVVDDAKEKERREREEAERRAIEEQIRAERAAEEAMLKVARDEEELRLKAENERLAAERKRLEEVAEHARREAKAEADRLAAERAKLEEERRAVEAARMQQEREEADRQSKIKAEQEAAMKAERERVAAAEAKVKEEQRRAAEETRIAALRPDVEKVKAFGASIRAMINPPQVTAPEAMATVKRAVDDLWRISASLEAFEAK